MVQYQVQLLFIILFLKFLRAKNHTSLLPDPIIILIVVVLLLLCLRTIDREESA